MSLTGLALPILFRFLAVCLNIRSKRTAIESRANVIVSAYGKSEHHSNYAIYVSVRMNDRISYYHDGTRSLLGRESVYMSSEAPDEQS